ncbi:MAG: CopD family protein [Nitrospirae bacterium]|nr:CopD family protein [Nitrospirota bacterium]
MTIHLVGAIAFIGGTMFYFAVYRPAAALLPPRPDQAAFTTKIEQRFRTVRWLSIVALLLTGFFNLLYEGGSARIASTYGGVLMLKLFLVLVLIALTGIHDFILATPGGIPGRGSAKPIDRGTGAEDNKRWLGAGILALALTIVFIAVILARM